MSQNQDQPDWTIRRTGDAWGIFKDGVADDGAEAPNGLQGVLRYLKDLPGDPPDLPDIGIASSRTLTNQERCFITGIRIRQPSFGSKLDARAQPADWQAVVFAPGGRRWYLHADATDMLAPRVAAALASYASAAVPEQPKDVAEWRRTVATNLLARAFAKGADNGPLLSAWCVRHAIELLASPARPKPADPGERRRREAVRG